MNIGIVVCEFDVFSIYKLRTLKFLNFNFSYGEKKQTNIHKTLLICIKRGQVCY